MEDGNRKLVIYFEDEEHIVRRLGAAAISCWDEIPRTIRAKLVERASKVLDADETGGSTGSSRISSKNIRAAGDLRLQAPAAKALRRCGPISSDFG
jgi:hypothetical protein